MDRKSIEAVLIGTMLAVTQLVDASVFLIDSFTVTKNGGIFFEDSFSDGSPPRNQNLEDPAPVDVNPTSRAYKTFPNELIGPETGGSLRIDTFAGKPLDADPVSQGAVEVVLCSLNTAKQDKHSALWKDDLIEITGRFDLSSPRLVKERFGIAVTDWTTDEQGQFVGNEAVELIVRLEPVGIRIKLRQANFELKRYDALQVWDPSLVPNIESYEQIELTLFNTADDLAGFFARISVIDSDAVLETFTSQSNAAARMFQFSDWLRPRFYALRKQQVCHYDSIPATASPARFTDHGDGTVTDGVTGLHWKRCEEGRIWDGVTCTGDGSFHTWEDALQLAGTSDYAEESDWRLPNIKELATTVEAACYSPAVHLGVFPGVHSNAAYWTSTPDFAVSEPSLMRNAFAIDFERGSELSAGRVDAPLAGVRLVRAGNTTSAEPRPYNDTGFDWWVDGERNGLAEPQTAFPGQDADSGRDALVDDDGDGHAGFVFTKLDSDGMPLPRDAAIWACVRDDVTGLVWERKGDDGGLRDGHWSYTWFNPDPRTNGGEAGRADEGDPGGTSGAVCYETGRCDTEKFIEDANVAGLCGADDWRLPWREELRSLIDYSRREPSIDTNYFPLGSSELDYWSAATYPDPNGPYSAWVVSFSDGRSYPALKDVRHGVRLVRNAAPSAWILGAPAFAGPGASYVADGGASRTFGRPISTYSWQLSGPCCADDHTDDVTLAISIDPDAPVEYPSTPCSLELSVIDGDGLTGIHRFDTIVLPRQYEDAMQEAYIAYYGRPADSAGLHYWGARLHQENGNLDALIGAYGTSDEYTSRFGGLDDETLIDTLYMNLFGRSADSAGRQWYIEERLIPYCQEWTDGHGGDPTGATEYALSRIALDILYGAQNQDRIIIDQKLEVARYFTEQVVRWGVTYDSPDIPVAASILQLVTADPQSVDQAREEVDAVIGTL
jgi:hypothetical protein